MPQLGLTELLIIGALVVLLFGSRLPGVGKALGAGIRNFKEGLSGGKDDSSNLPEKKPAKGLSSRHASDSTTQTAPVDDAGTSSSEASPTSEPIALKARVQNSNPPMPLSGSTQSAPTSSHTRAKVVDADSENQG